MDKATWNREWFRFADMDYRAAREMAAFYPSLIELVCYHAQQSAEKNLKAYIVYKTGDEPEHTHNLRKLREQCEEIDVRFKEISTACSMLSPYAVAAKYPDESRISEDQINAWRAGVC
jgi:HEPN domain-containing protein